VAKVVTLNALYEGIAGGNVLADSALEIHALTHSTFIASGRVVRAKGREFSPKIVGFLANYRIIFLHVF